MKAKPALPERVRSMEGLGVIRASETLKGFELSSRLALSPVLGEREDGPERRQ